MFSYGFAEESYAFYKVCKNKSREQFKNALRVFYGKKKDRGHLKQKIEAYKEDAKKLGGDIDKAMERRFGYSFSSLLNAFGGGLY